MAGWVAVLAVTARPLTAQARPPALAGELRARLPADTVWYPASVAWVDGCPGIKLDGDPALSDVADVGGGLFFVRSPGSLVRLERRTGPGAAWELVPGELRRELDACFAERARP